MEVKVLGPVEATVGPRPVAVSAHQRLIIAVLAANAGNPVPADVLIEAVWSDRLPSKPLAALQNLISRLRMRLPADRATAIGTAGSGYLLDPTACSIDWMHFERALQEARRDADAVASLAAYRAALEAWRGAAYGELADRPELAAHAHRLEELAAVAREELAALMTGLDPVGAVIELEALVARQPFRERGHALLMEALHRCHRQRDALAVFRDYERFLGEELGLAPSPALRELESLILTDALDQPARHAGHRLVDAVVTAGPATTIERTHNLPERLTSFVGRDEDLAAV
ncbi:MAG: BTAD domain-containing putative transcriptional regulator, partial [Microbacteriaceae bacterium]